MSLAINDGFVDLIDVTDDTDFSKVVEVGAQGGDSLVRDEICHCWRQCKFVASGVREPVKNVLAEFVR